MKLRKYILSIYCLIGFTSCTLSQDITPLFPCTTTLESPYGAVCHFTSIYRDFPVLDREMDMLCKAGIENARIDYWLDYSKQDIFKDTLISVMDITTKKMRDVSVDILPIIFVGFNEAHPWDYRHNYQLFLNHLITNYHNDFRFVEVMNEVNFVARREDITLDSLARVYTDVLSDTYQDIKKNSPNTKVLSSGLAGIADRFLETLSDYQAFKYFDILNIHSYNAPEDLPEVFKYLRRVMNKHNWETPIWLSECGMSTYIDSLKIKSPIDIHVRERENEYEQACRLPRIFLVSFAYGIDKVFWYELRSRELDIFDKEEHFGLLHADLTPKPAYYAYKTLIQFCPSGSSRPSLEVDEDMYVSSWQRPDGEYVWAIWNKSQKKTITCKVKGTPQYYNYLGKKIKRPKTIGVEVTYIVGAKSVEIK